MSASPRPKASHIDLTDRSVNLNLIKGILYINNDQDDIFSIRPVEKSKPSLFPKG